MPSKQPEDFQYLSNNPDFTPDPEIESFMEEEISRAPKDPDNLADRLSENTHVSLNDAGGDPDADLADLASTGTDSFMGDNPSPDANDTDENARAAGVSFQDNQELEFIDTIDRRDRDRFEFDPASKTEDNSI